MNVDKMGPETLREGIRLEYPHYDNFEWSENKASWGEPKDTFSVPTGNNIYAQAFSLDWAFFQKCPIK